MDDEFESGDHIELISTTEKDKDGRIERLNRVLGYAAALADAQNNKLVFVKVVSLEDSRGNLTVTWNRKPTEAEKNIFLKSWESRVGDGGDSVLHKVAPVIRLELVPG